MQEKEPPTFFLEELSLIGELKVSFSQSLLVIDNPDDIDDTVFKLELQIDESSISRLYDDEIDYTNYEFTWQVT